MDILDQILGAEMANEYTDSQRLAHTEKKVLTYDGNVEDRKYFDSDGTGMYHVRVSDKAIDLESVEKIVCTATQFTLTLEKKDLRFEKLDDHCQSLNGYLGATEGRLIFVYDYGEGHPATGTHLIGFEDVPIDGFDSLTGWVSYVEYDVTVHQIPKEYIPNTVINLCDYGINIFQMIETQSLVSPVQNASDLISKIPTDGRYFSVVHDDGMNPIIKARGDVVTTQSGGFGCLSVNTAMYYSKLNTVLSLNISISYINEMVVAFLTMFHPNYVSPFTE